MQIKSENSARAYLDQRARHLCSVSASNTEGDEPFYVAILSADSGLQACLAALLRLNTGGKASAIAITTTGAMVDTLQNRSVALIVIDDRAALDLAMPPPEETQSTAQGGSGPTNSQSSLRTASLLRATGYDGPIIVVAHLTSSNTSRSMHDAGITRIIFRRDLDGVEVARALIAAQEHARFRDCLSNVNALPGE